MSEERYQRIFSENLRYYMQLNNKTQINLINDLGFNKSAVSTWVNGTRLPRMDKVDRLANYFGVKRSDLTDEHDKDASSTSEEALRKANVLHKYDCLSPEAQSQVEDYLDFLLNKGK